MEVVRSRRGFVVFVHWQLMVGERSSSTSTTVEKEGTELLKFSCFMKVWSVFENDLRHRRLQIIVGADTGHEARAAALFVS